MCSQEAVLDLLDKDYTSKLLIKSIKSVTDDEGFRVTSSEAAEAIKTAISLEIWSTDTGNTSTFADFSMRLIESLVACFNSKAKTSKLKREHMWREYHKLRTSSIFANEWQCFLESAQLEASPTFYQYVSDELFKYLIKQRHPIYDAPGSGEECNEPIMTHVEENALRYVIGFICRRLKEHFESSSDDNKDDIIFLILSLSGDEMDEEAGTETWTNSIDRGGLWHIKDDVYMIFSIMEQHIRKYFKTSAASELNDGVKVQIVTDLMKNEELLFEWRFITAEFDENIATTVLERMIKLYVTIRGFAFAKSCLELYKQRHNRKIQKSKPLRKELFSLDVTGTEK